MVNFLLSIVETHTLSLPGFSTGMGEVGTCTKQYLGIKKMAELKHSLCMRKNIKLDVVMSVKNT